MIKPFLLLLSVTIAQAQWHYGPRIGKHQILSAQGSAAGLGLKHIKNGTFEQLLDHSNPSLGTFSQAFYWDSQYYKGEGSPIIMQSPSESNATGLLSLLTDSTIIGELAKRVGGATVYMEHRYWGNSSPYPELTTANMQYQTLENAIADLTYFADNVKLPFAVGNSNANSVPWVLIGGSYSGALTAWTAAKAPGTFWAYQASSAVVQTISNFWQYYKQVAYGMPENCSTDVSSVINHMDSVLASGSAQEIHELKAMFGLETVEHNDDFMSALTGGPNLWQNPQFFVFDDGFYEWCDYVENAVNTTTVPGASGVGLQKALKGYAKWFKDVYLPDYCKDTYSYFRGGNNTECFNTYNASSPIFTDVTVSNTADRQWTWFLCNQPFGWWADGLPKGMPSIVSRLLNPEYYVRQCSLYFPTGPEGQTYGIAKGATEAEVNAYTGGWNIDNTTRLIYANGQFDPWRDATVSSFYRPGGPLASTSRVPVNVVPEGNHCSDWFTANAKANAGVKAVYEAELSQLQQWLAEYPK